MKDFDFQIKKNHEDITAVKDRMEGLTKDLDDLVSLYEIVSEQMNPFVGLSKVTKKRLDALENFTREVDELKNRMSEIESVIEVNRGVIGDIEKQMTEHERIIPQTISQAIATTPSAPQTSTEKKETIELPTTVITATTTPLAPTTIPTPAPFPSQDEWDQLINSSLESFLFDLKLESMLDEFVTTLIP
ncbi:MAG: flagella accessory protein C [Methanobacteriota archaeon]